MAVILFGWIFFWIYFVDVIYCEKITNSLNSSTAKTNSFNINNPCLSLENSCFNGGTCVATDNASNTICICTSGFTGQKCESKSNSPCLNNICSNGGSCFLGENGVMECVCSSGYTGQLCEVILNENCPIPCPIDSVCRNNQCECPRGSVGNPGSCKSDPCSNNPCLNGATCLNDEKFLHFTCSCSPGFSGNFCQIRPLSDSLNGPCKKVQCPFGQKCINRGEIVSCVPATELNAPSKPLHPVATKLAFNITNLTQTQPPETHLVTTFPLIQSKLPCPSQTCLNGGTCFNDTNGLFCQCRSGFTGLRCENDLDECTLLKNPCKHGVCQNQGGSYQCYCRPGYMGANCTDDFDECYSNPCKNDGTCLNTMGSYECLCTARFTGAHCENPLHSQILLRPQTNPPPIDGQQKVELCSNKKCYNGGSCIDNLVGFQCICPPGYSGLLCNDTISKDPCNQNPCTSGQCMNAANELGYTCECDDEHDPNCGSPKDLCSQIICLNKGSCNITTGLCNCLNGFTGTTCEIAPLPLSTKKVAIKACSLTGAPKCSNGATCVETSGSYSCLCPAGYSGRNCEHEIDECRSSQQICGPNSEKCLNLKVGFKCICRESFGGQFCNVSLHGCVDVTCNPEQICKPTEDSHGHQSHTCQCPEGRAGENCLEDTTVSFVGNSLMAYVTPINNPNSYALNFRFKTTVADSVLVSGDSVFGNNFIIFLNAGRIRCSFKDQDIKQRTLVNDGLWYELMMRLNSTHAVLKLFLSNFEIESQSLLLNSQTFRPIFTTKFGGPSLPQVANDYIGCMQNVVVDAHVLLPKQLQQSSLNIQFGCPRVEQCRPNSCSGNGKCVDLWSNHKCLCKRPYLQPNCVSALPESTFGYGSNRSYAEIQMNSTEKQIISQTTDISMLIRTRSSNGSLVYIGSESSIQNVGPSESFLAVQLENGRLKCTAKIGQQTPLYITGGPLLNDGVVHLIRVNRVGGNIDGFIDDNLAFTEKLPGRYVYPLFADLFLIGGFSTTSKDKTRHKRVVGESHISPEAFTTDKTFKGTIQDPRINDMLIILSPSVDEDSLQMELFGLTELKNNVLQGTVSDDTCEAKPCLHGGHCTVTFNDYNCSCVVGWRGKTCHQEDYCYKNPCQKGSHCKNLEPDGYVCLSDVTLSNSSSAHFSLINVNSSDIFFTVSFKIRTRDKKGVILFMDDGSSKSFLSVELVGGGLNVAYSLGTAQVFKTDHATDSVVLNDGAWHSLMLNLLGDNSFLKIDNETNEFPLQGASTVPLSDIFSKSTSRLFVGSLPSTLSNRVSNLHGFKGCLSDVMFGIPTESHSAFPLSFYKSVEGGNLKNKHFELIESENVEYECHGDPVCDKKCKNGATCVDLFDDFRCECILGFDGNLCENNIDDCVKNNCQNNSTCIDGIANYTCSCEVGTTGSFCETEIDECASSPCMNNATCSDLRNGYQCTCNEDFSGKRCEFSLRQDCNSNPCMHNGRCTDVKIGTKKSFNCTCHPSYFGSICDQEVNFCEKTPCQSNGTCVSHADTQDVTCTCPLGFEGKLCEINIDDCQSHPCQHGNCIDGIANFTCQCHQGWRGFVCGDDVDECLSSPCSTKATCVNSPGNFTCLCPKYYLGEFCEIEGGCLKSPCSKGECEQLSATALRCLCPFGYTGQFCETEINFCDSNPCLNGANCSHFVGNYSCQCRPGFTGVNCETNVNECGSNPCQNRGVCVDEINKFSCSCNGTGYSGELCQHDIDECSLPGYCNEGTCRNLIGTYNCSCNNGFVGPKCNFKDPCVKLNATSTKCKNNGKCHNPKVLEAENRIDYDCLCSQSFVGDLCETPRQPLTSDGPPLVYIIAPIVGFVLLVCLISCVAFVMVARKKRATRGTYSPSRQEMTGARVQMGAMMKPPPEERLI